MNTSFGHASQVGAFMNEAYQAQHGLEPDLFPQAVPTYLGHYHLPHSVGDSNVRYVGSPYQGEASTITNFWQ